MLIDFFERGTNKLIHTYTEMSKLKTFEERFEYLKLNGLVGVETFGWDRYLNQALYQSPEWRRCRRIVILRDNGCDLGVDGYSIGGRIIIHHINPISIEMIENRDFMIFDLDNLVCVSHQTHEAIHYGSTDILPKEPVERKPGDTKLW